MNFAVSRTRNDELNLLGSSESYIAGLDNVPAVERDQLRQQVSNIVRNVPRCDNLNDDGMKAMKMLKNDINIVKMPADKGRITVTVVMDRAEYVQKCEEHLNDPSLYQKN